jgi:hypothetical protein
MLGDCLVAAAASDPGVLMAVLVPCRYLTLNTNQLSGTIPSTLGKLTALT